MEKLLIIDDDESIKESLRITLSQVGYKVFVAEDAERGLEQFDRFHPDLIICDLKLPGMNGIEFLKRVKSCNRYIPFIIITAYEDSHSTIEAIQQGAYDYFEKPLEVEKLKVTVRRALEGRKISEHLSVTISKDLDEYKLENSFIGKTPVMKEILKKIGKVSTNRVSILIQGESGTGKELITKVIHYSGITKTKPFIAVNCTALSESLLESELFGHVKGAFTGAVNEKKGKFELAGEGTIFLDEISEMSTNLQVKLLRVLQEKEFERVGGEETIKVDVRVIAATNKNLEREISEGRFRDDLYYRLNIVPILMPPLRERKDDIPYLVEHFLQKIGKELGKEKYKFIDEAMQKMMDYHWPGNVRELENIVERSLVLTENKQISSKILPFGSSTANRSENSELLLSPGVIPLQKAIEQVEIKLISRALRYSNGNKAAAARLLGLKSNTLFYKMDRYNLGN